MRIFRAKADENGRIPIGAGWGLLVSPQDHGALFPVELEFNSTGRRETLREARALYTRFSSAAVHGAEAGSWWLVYVAEAEGEIIGAPDELGKMELIASGELSGVYTNATYFLGHGTANGLYYDVGRFRGVYFFFSTDIVMDLSPVSSFSAYLAVSGHDEAGVNATSIEMGAINEFVDGGRAGEIHIGETAGLDIASEYARHRPGRWPYARPQFKVVGEIELDGSNTWALWGVP
jgi:hypothetical protein